MPLTRLELEAEVNLLVGRLMAMVGIYGKGADGFQVYLNTPIRDGLREMGYPVADAIRVVDADLLNVDNFAVKRLIEWVELYVLQQVQRDWWRVFERPPMGLTPEVLQQVYGRINTRIGELKEIVKKTFTPFVLPLAVGQVTIGSAFDPTTPRRIDQVVPPWVLSPHSYWYYGCEPSVYWGWGGDC